MGYDVIALGELLIDFTPAGDSLQGNPLYEANPGGAPCNVLAMLSKLNKRVAFIGKVGKDMHGHFLNSSIKECGIESSGLIMESQKDTTLAFVSFDSTGDRDFSFIRKSGADIALHPDEIDSALFLGARIFHFGSLSMTDEPARSATKRAVELALENGCIISFDPNMRELLWSSMELAKEQMLWGCARCSVIKLAKEELFFLTDADEFGSGVNILWNRFPNLNIVLVTDGIKGSYAFYQSQEVFVPAFLNEKTIDTTGAGDTFMGCCLNYLLENDTGALTAEQINQMLTFANAAASLVTMKKGALRSMPGKDEIIALIDSN